MSESQDPTARRDIADLIALVEEIVSYWRELARRRFEANPPATGSSFEEHWPRLLDNFFLAETVRIAKALRQLSDDSDN